MDAVAAVIIIFCKIGSYIDFIMSSFDVVLQFYLEQHMLDALDEFYHSHQNSF